MSNFGNVELNSVNVKQLTGLVVLFYLGLAFFASLPFMLCGVLNPVDAYVEGMGMVTTTGVTLVGIDELPGMFILWRSVMQWLGGFLALVLFALLLPRVVHQPIYAANRELGDCTDWHSLPGWYTTLRMLSLFYLTVTVLVDLGLMCFGLNGFDAANFALTLVSTGGLSGVNTFTAWQLSNGLKIFMALVMLVAGGNYFWYYFVVTGQVGKIIRDVQFRAYLGGTVVAVLLLWLSGKCFGNQSESLVNIICQVTSCLSSTGYVFVNSAHLSGFAYLVLATLVFIGGCAGSPAGGMKISRVVLSWKLVDCNVRSVYRPHLVQQVEYNGKRLPNESLGYVSLFFFAYVVMIMLVGLCLAAEGLAPVDALVTAVGLVSNTGSMFNLSCVSWFTKLVMTFGMLAGRLEILSMLLVFLPEFWQRKSRW